MIMAILAIYGSILFLLEKFGIIRWNHYWTASFPGLWLLLQIALMIPMGWGNPQGPALVVRTTVQITPNVPGEVIDVPVVANTPLKAGDVLFRIDPVPYEATVKSIQAQLTFQEQRLAQARELQDHNAGRMVDVLERQAMVDNLRGQLESARWNLEKTIVRAPADGFVTNMALRPGARVASAPVMAFVETSETGIGVEITQNNARYIEPGQPVEVAFKFAPGAIYTGKVRHMIQAVSSGQVGVSGTVVTPKPIESSPFVVVVDLDDKAFARRLPMGSTGDAAIFTRHATFTRPIRWILLRQLSILNYVNPF